MNRVFPARASLIFVMIALAPAISSAQTNNDDILNGATTLVATAAEDLEIAGDLQTARAVAVIPGIRNVRFIFGGLTGTGVLVTRNADGLWTNPAFVRMGGASFGLQAGFDRLDMVLVFATEESVENLLNDSLKFTGRGELSFHAGQSGGQASKLVAPSGDVRGHVVGRRGWSGSAALEGSRIRLDDDSNEEFYEASATAPFENPTDTTPQSALRLIETLMSTRLADRSGPKTRLLGRSLGDPRP